MTKSIFINLLHAQEKEAGLATAVGALSSGEECATVHALEPAAFGAIPGAPFAYWASEGLRSLFTTLRRFEGAGRTAKQGLATADDFRFVRGWWEVAADRVVSGTAHTKPEEFRAQTFAGKPWVPFAKGGAYSPYYADLHLVVDWENAGERIKTTVNDKGKVPSNVTMLRRTEGEHFFRPGLTWPRRTQGGLSIRALPAGTIFADKGPAAFTTDAELLSLLAIANSESFRELVELQMAFGSYEVGVIQRTPVPELRQDVLAALDGLAHRALEIKQALDGMVETSHLFCVPGLLHVQGNSIADRITRLHQEREALANELCQIQSEIDQRVAATYGISAVGTTAGTGSGSAVALEDEADEHESTDSRSPATLVFELVSYLVGVIFGRWDVRLASQSAMPGNQPSPFAPLPSCPPGMLRLPASNGIAVADPSDPRDLVRSVRAQLDVLFTDGSQAEEEICSILAIKDLDAYINGKFATEHFKRYSMSRRKAPIYWQLRSPKKHYDLWLYYPSLTKDTLYIALRDYVGPKLAHEEEILQAVKAQVAKAKLAGVRVEQIAREFEAQEAIVRDVAALRDELKAVVDAGYDPDLDDGVLINIAPLHKLVPWKDAAACYKELKAGTYPWSSMHQRYTFR